MVTRRILPFYLLLVVCGCASTGDQAPPPDPVQSGFLGVATVRGRPFVLDLADVTGPMGPYGPQRSYYAILAIQGDDRHISFAVTVPAGAPAPRPNVTADAFELGGHTLAVTDVPGEYVSDGVPVALPLSGLHVFQDGAYHGIEHINGW